MELRHLRYFLAVAEELHFGRAAQRLHLSQPPLSQQIRKFESELQVELFKRTSRRVELTAAGKSLMTDALDILAHVDDAVERTRSAARGDEGFLQIGFVPMAMDMFLPGVLADFGDKHPRVSLALIEMGTNDQLESLRSGRLQVALPRLYGHDLHGLDHEPVLRERYALAVPAVHRLAKSDAITVPDLEDVNLILSPRHVQPRVYDRIVESCQEAGFRPRVLHEAISKRSCLALVAAGMGVSLVPSSTPPEPIPGVSCRKLDADWPPLEIAVVWPSGPVQPGLESLLRVIRAHRRLEEPNGSNPSQGCHVHNC